tara:strand:+ start:2280 stop:3203 length:924 start_codon:yes stop_codon:yes gene_type:complete
MSKRIKIRSGIYKRIFIHSLRDRNGNLKKATPTKLNTKTVFAQYQDLTLKELQIKQHSYNQCFDIVQEMYLYILKHWYRQNNSFGIRRFINSKTNTKYFVSLTNYILHWKLHQGRQKFTDFKSIIKEYFNICFREGNFPQSFYFKKNRPLPNQLLTDRSLLEWEGYWDKYDEDHGYNIKEGNGLFQKQVVELTNKEKMCKKKFGFGDSIECHNYWVHKINKTREKLKYSKLMIEIQNWESDWDNSEVERERKLKIKNSKCKSSFNLIMMIQVKTVYKKVKDIKSVFEKFPHLLPETVRFYIKAEGLI